MGRDRLTGKGLSIATPACLIGLMVALAGCASQNTSTHLAPVSFEQRHPIVVEEAPTVLDLPVGQNRTHLTAGMKSAITGFAVDYDRSGGKGVSILVPSGSSNEAAAGHLARHAKQHLVQSGVAKKHIAIVPYSVRDTETPGNIRLSFQSIKAHVDSECGVWPTDLGQTFNNENYENFGCATQSNLAAIVADPNDLINPRGNGEINAERTAIVVGDFESNVAPTVAPVPVADAF